MPTDNKYGHITTEHGHIPDDEPVILFRAQDALLAALLDEYHELCEQAGSPPRHLRLITEAQQRIITWQNTHPVKTPDSESSRAWLTD